MEDVGLDFPDADESDSGVGKKQVSSTAQNCSVVPLHWNRFQN